MPRAPTPSSAQTVFSQNGAAPAGSGGAAGSATGVAAGLPATQHLASVDLPPSNEPVKVSVSYEPGSGELVVKVSRPARAAKAATGPGAGTAYVFRKRGKLWEIIFNGGEAFYLEDTLGVRYLDYLLHHPNVPISAFELEVAIQPEKGEVRCEDSIQPVSDQRAKHAYRRELGRLQAERSRAKKGGDVARVRELDQEIKKFSTLLSQRGGMADTGERARDNVRHAVFLVLKLLKTGGPAERAFAEHLEACVSIGHVCLYSQSAGRIWV